MNNTKYERGQSLVRVAFTVVDMGVSHLTGKAHTVAHAVPTINNDEN